MSNIFIHQTLSQHEGDLDLSSILHLLWSRKWFILFVILCALSLGFIYSYKQKPQYQTDVLLQIDDKKQNNTSIGGLSRKLDLGSPSENSAATHSALIQSRFILEPVIKSLGLDIKVRSKQAWLTYLFSHAPDKKIKINVFKVPPQYTNKPFTLNIDQNNHLKLFSPKNRLVLEGQVGKLNTNPERDISLEIPSIANKNPQQLILIKQADAEVLQSLLSHIKIKDLGGKENTGVLQVSLRGENPKQMIQILNAIAEQSQLKDTEKKSLEASKALKFLYQQLPIVKQSLDEAETSLNHYRATSGKIDIKLQSQSLLAQLEDLDKQQNALRVNHVDMSQRYTASHPHLIALSKQIEKLGLKRHELEKLLKKLPASDQIAVNLMRDVEVKNSLYLVLLNKIQELEFVKAGTVSNVRILSHAKLPDEPLPNHNKIIWFGSILLGLFFSILYVFIRKLLTTQVSDPYWIERNLNLVNLAIIPYCREQTINTKKYKTHSVDHLPLLAQCNPRNLSIEALRSLRTTLQININNASNNIVSILGISPGVGKTFVSSNLAWLLAVAGKRVLLIDGDFRRGVLHSNFNLSSKPGFVDYLSKNCSLEQVLRNAGHPNLTIITRGSFIADPSEMIMSKAFKDTIHLLSEQYDIVVIDTAPVLLVTDGALIAGLAGTNYLVMGAAAHQPNDIMMVMKRLSSADVKVQGAIFNFFKAEAKNQRYSYYHGYYYEDEET